jgi:hypothetical protein
METRAEIYRAKARMCEHLAAAVDSDAETKQRALELARKWRELAHDAEQVDEMSMARFILQRLVAWRG